MLKLKIQCSQGGLREASATMAQKNALRFFPEVIIPHVNLKGNNVKNYLQYENCVI